MLDTAHIRVEAFPLVGLSTPFAGMALNTFVFVIFLAGSSGLGILLTLVAQFVLAVGTGVVLMYVVA